MSLPPNDEPEQKDDHEITRQSLLSALPKRTFHRVILLLAALAGIIYLRQRTDSIAGCMSSAFEARAPISLPNTAPSIKATVLLPDGGSR